MPVQQNMQTSIANGTTAIAQQPQQNEPDAVSIDLMELMYRLLAGWKLILCLALCFAIASAVYTIYFVKPLYSATSVIYVLNPDSIVNVSSLQIGSALTNDYIKLFNLWEIHDRVKRELNLSYSYSKLKSMLKVTNTSGTRMLDISVTSVSGKEAAEIANKYAQVAREFIAEKMAADMPSIMSEALVPTNPVSPSKTRNIALGFIIGALLGIGIITLRTLMDDKLKTVEDIRQYTGLITLAVVPIEEDDSVDKKNTRRKT